MRSRRAAAALGAAVGLIVPTASLAAGASSGAPPAITAEIVRSFAHLATAPPTVAGLRPYVQAMDPAMAKALRQATTSGAGQGEDALPTGTVSVSAIHPTSPRTASVTFAVENADPTYVTRYVGSAALSGGSWKVSWVTLCMLIEDSGVVCPNPPRGTVTPLPLPYSLTGRQQALANSPDLVSPASLALLPGGDLLIVDQLRDEILEWHPGGALTVFAGTGAPGFSGDGGPAVDARLDWVSGLSVSADGSVVFVDGNRVREISPGGVITTVAGDGKAGDGGDGGPALDASLTPSDVAISPSGTLYIATGSAVREVAPDGVISTLARGGPPYGVDVKTPQGTMAFLPDRIALDGAGNLDVFSFSPKEMFQVSASGKIRLLGAAYSAQMTTAPNGAVVFAGHGESVGEITPSGRMSTLRDLSRLRVRGLSYPGEVAGYESSGIAAAVSGDLYLDSFEGNGYAGGTSLVELTPGGSLVALPITTPLLDTLPALGSSGFPAHVYPAALGAAGSDLAACPNPQGLESFDAAAVAAAFASAARYNSYTSSLWGDLRSSDRSWWAGLFATWASPDYDRDTHTVESEGPASADPFAPAIAHACGEWLLRESIVIDVGPSAYSSQVSHLFFVDRAGRPLVYFQAS